jgi:hypothetical protein
MEGQYSIGGCSTYCQAQILVVHGKYVGNKKADGQEKHDDQTVNQNDG